MLKSKKNPAFYLLVSMAIINLLLICVSIYFNGLTFKLMPYFLNFCWLILLTIVLEKFKNLSNQLEARDAEITHLKKQIDIRDRDVEDFKRAMRI